MARIYNSNFILRLPIFFSSLFNLVLIVWRLPSDFSKPPDGQHIYYNYCTTKCVFLMMRLRQIHSKSGRAERQQILISVSKRLSGSTRSCLAKMAGLGAVWRGSDGPIVRRPCVFKVRGYRLGHINMLPIIRIILARTTISVSFAHVLLPLFMWRNDRMIGHGPPFPRPQRPRSICISGWTSGQGWWESLGGLPSCSLEEDACEVLLDWGLWPVLIFVIEVSLRSSNLLVTIFLQCHQLEESWAGLCHAVSAVSTIQLLQADLRLFTLRLTIYSDLTADRLEDR